MAEVVVVIGELIGGTFATNSFLLPLYYNVVFPDIRFYVLMIR